MLGKTNAILIKKEEIKDNQFDPSKLTLKRCEILNSSADVLELKGTSSDSYHADYVINGVTNKMKILSFSCEFHSTTNTGYVMIYAGKSQLESNIAYSYDEVTDLGKVNLNIPIIEDYMEIRFGCNGDYTSISEVTFSNIQLSISEEPIQLLNNGTLNYEFDWKNPISSQTIPKGYTEGGEINVLFPDKQVKMVDPSTETVHVVPDEGKLLEEVWINPIQTQSKTVTPSSSKQDINPDDENFLSSVTVNAIPDSAYEYESLNVRNVNVDSGGTSTSSVLNAGIQKYKTVVMSYINASYCVLEISNDNTNWYPYFGDGSSDSSASGTSLKTTIRIFPNLTYRYYRITLTGYNNGYRSSCGLAVARSSV